MTNVQTITAKFTKSKVMILLSDGSNNAGELDPNTAADLAKQFGIKIYTIKLSSLRNCAGKEKQRHYCHLCEKSFSLKEGLDRHIKHIHQKILNYHCEHCDYKTYAGFNLR